MTTKINIPVYFQQTKAKKVLASMNWFRNAHWGTQNKYKQELSFHIKNQIGNILPITTRYSVTYTYFYKDTRSDLMNVCALASKVLNDALQELELVPNDSVLYLVKEVCVVGDKSLNDPRVEAVIDIELF